MVAARCITRTVVGSRKLAPVLCFQGGKHTGVFHKARKEFELHLLRVAHLLYKPVDALGSAFLPVETAYLEHSPEGGHIGGIAVDFAGGIETCPLSARVIAMTAGVNRAQGGASGMTFKRHSAFLEHPGEDSSVEIYHRHSGRGKSAVLHPGLDIHYSVENGRLNAEFGSHAAIVLVGEARIPCLYLLGVEQAPHAHTLAHHRVDGYRVGTWQGEIKRHGSGSPCGKHGDKQHKSQCKFLHLCKSV